MHTAVCPGDRRERSPGQWRWYRVSAGQNRPRGHWDRRFKVPTGPRKCGSKPFLSRMYILLMQRASCRWSTSSCIKPCRCGTPTASSTTAAATAGGTREVPPSGGGCCLLLACCTTVERRASDRKNVTANTQFLRSPCAVGPVDAHGSGAHPSAHLTRLVLRGQTSDVTVSSHFQARRRSVHRLGLRPLRGVRALCRLCGLVCGLASDLKALYVIFSCTAATNVT